MGIYRIAYSASAYCRKEGFDDQKTINGILYVFNTGCLWHDMPRRYGSYQTAWRRLKRWSREGVWAKILESAQEHAYETVRFNLDIVGSR